MELKQCILNLVQEWGKSPWDINNGECEEFAYALLGVLLPDPYEQTEECYEMVSDDVAPEFALPGHMWVFYQGKHYDAECPEGVESWRDLPIFATDKNVR